MGMESLCNELLEEVAGYLSNRDVISLAGTSHMTRRFARGYLESRSFYYRHARDSHSKRLRVVGQRQRKRKPVYVTHYKHFPSMDTEFDLHIGRWIIDILSMDELTEESSSDELFGFLMSLGSSQVALHCSIPVFQFLPAFRSYASRLKNLSVHFYCKMSFEDADILASASLRPDGAKDFAVMRTREMIPQEQMCDYDKSDVVTYEHLELVLPTCFSMRLTSHLDISYGYQRPKRLVLPSGKLEPIDELRERIVLATPTALGIHYRLVLGCTSHYLNESFVFVPRDETVPWTVNTPPECDDTGDENLCKLKQRAVVSESVERHLTRFVCHFCKKLLPLSLKGFLVGCCICERCAILDTGRFNLSEENMELNLIPGSRSGRGVP